MKNIKFATIAMVLILLLSLASPLVAAQDFERLTSSNERIPGERISDERILQEMMMMPSVDLSKMSSISEEDIEEITSLVYLFLEMGGGAGYIESLDLSDLRTSESSYTSEIAGNMSFLVNGMELELTFHSIYDMQTNSFDMFSRSDDFFLRMSLNVFSESADYVTYSLNTVFIQNNIVQRNTEFFTMENSGEQLTASTAKEDNSVQSAGPRPPSGQFEYREFRLPSGPPRLSTLMVRDVRLHNILNAASVTLILGGVITAFFTKGFSLAVAQAIAGGAGLLLNNFLADSRINTRYTFVDIYKMTTWMIFIPPRGVIGVAMGVPNPAMPITQVGVYLEVNRYWKLVPVN